MARFNSHSQRVRVAGPGADPEVAISTLLRAIVDALGPGLLGHAKAIARVDGGAIHGSTTGVPPSVNITIVGHPEMPVEAFEVDVLCVFHGVSMRRLSDAWRRAVAGLRQRGFEATCLSLESPDVPRAGDGATGGVCASLLASLVALKPCCVLPALWSLSGAALGALDLFEPLEAYRPGFIALSVGLLSTAFYRLYIGPPVAMNRGVRASIRRGRLLWWCAALVLVVATLAPYVVPLPMQHGSPDHLHGQ